MVEIDFNNPLIHSVRPCRRMVLDGTPVLDKIWDKKVSDEQRWYGGSGNYILTRKKTQVPKGMKVEFELEPGADMSALIDKNSGSIIGDDAIPVHVCTREMAKFLGQRYGWDGVVPGGRAEGMKYIYVNKDDLPEVRRQIKEFIDPSSIKHE